MNDCPSVIETGRHNMAAVNGIYEPWICLSCHREVERRDWNPGKSVATLGEIAELLNGLKARGVTLESLIWVAREKVWWEEADALVTPSTSDNA